MNTSNPNAIKIPHDTIEKNSIIEAIKDEKNLEEILEENIEENIEENLEKIKDIAINFIENFDDPQEKNLLFTGNTGLGKTFLTNCIANELLKQGKTVLYQTAPVMLDSILDYRFGKNNDFNYSLFKMLTESSFISEEEMFDDEF